MRVEGLGVRVEGLGVRVEVLVSGVEGSIRAGELGARPWLG